MSGNPEPIWLVDPSHLTALLEEQSDIDSLNTLILVEQELRRRLKVGHESSSDWLASLSAALANDGATRGSQQRAELMMVLVQWHLDEGQHELAIRTAQKVLVYVQGLDAPALLRRALNVLGGAQLRTKDLTGATISFVRALEIAERIGDRFGRCAVLANLAATRLAAGLLDEAVKLFEHVLEIAGEEAPYRNIVCDAYHNLSLAYLCLSDAKAADSHMRSAIHLLSDPRTKYAATQRVLMELTFAKVHVDNGRIAEARSRAEIASALNQRVSNRLATIQSQLALALCEAAEGKSDIALTRLAELEQQIEPGELSFRDFLEIELKCNWFAGRFRYAKHYNKKYLSDLAKFQRRTAIEQVNAIKRTFKPEPAEKLRPSARMDAALRLWQDRVEALAVLAELREDATGEHSFRVGRMSAMLALSVGYDDSQAAVIEMASRLHDIGKLATPDSVLLKRGRLSAAEAEIMRRHATEGCQILADILVASQETDLRALSNDFQVLRLAAEIAQSHHEWWDGSGYPRGIAGERIPEAARIVALADVFDELTHRRPYKRQFTKEESVAQIKALSGRQFEPRLCAEFLKIIEELPTVAERPESSLPAFGAANRIIQRIVASLGNKAEKSMSPA